MMSLRFKSPLALALLASSANCVYAQTSPSTSAPPEGGSTECFAGIEKDLKDRFASNPPDRAMALNNLKDMSIYICYFSTAPFRAKFLGTAEQSRLDKQPGASSNSSGSTSLISKGSSPWLLGFALEHGGLTQTTSGNTITFRGNVANSIRALMKSTYVSSYDLGKDDKLVQALAKLSFGVSFDTSASQPSAAQGFSPSKENLSGFSSKYEIINHRDPRDRRWHKNWAAVAQQATALAQSFAGLNQVVAGNPRFQDWMQSAEKALAALPPGSDLNAFEKLVKDVADLFGRLFWNVPEVRDAVRSVTSQITTYLDAETDLLNTIRTSPLLTVEYNFVRQLTTNNQSVTATQPAQPLPSLSNINLVLEKGMHGANAPEFTLNVGTTLFNSTSLTIPKHGTVRDYRASAQMDIPLKEITNIGKPTLSFSGEFLGLLEEPLGQKVMLNGVTVDRRGNMGVFQSKLTIPVKDSGVKIPISFTYASRTELIKEKDVRGNIGITFDLDTLFSKSK